MYSFEVHFKKYLRENATLNDTRHIYVSGICLVAKNTKRSGFYFARWIKRMDGKFSNIAGSISYPILYPIMDVVIRVEDFPKYPILELSSPEFKPHIFITNIKNFESDEKHKTV